MPSPIRRLNVCIAQVQIDASQPPSDRLATSTSPDTRTSTARWVIVTSDSSATSRQFLLLRYFFKEKYRFKINPTEFTC